MTHSRLPTALGILVLRDSFVVRTLLADGAGVNARRMTSLARELG